MKVVRNPRSHYFPAPPTIRLNSGDHGDQDRSFDAQTTACMADRRHGLSPEGVSVLPCPRRTEPSHIWKWANRRTKHFSPGGTSRSSSHFVAFYRTLLMKNASLSSRLPGSASRDFLITGELNWDISQIPNKKNDVSKPTAAFIIDYFNKNLSRPEKKQKNKKNPQQILEWEFQDLNITICRMWHSTEAHHPGITMLLPQKRHTHQRAHWGPVLETLNTPLGGLNLMSPKDDQDENPSQWSEGETSVLQRLKDSQMVPDSSFQRRPPLEATPLSLLPPDRIFTRPYWDHKDETGFKAVHPIYNVNIKVSRP